VVEAAVEAAEEFKAGLNWSMVLKGAGVVED
jgi:hypothetical protein